MKAKIAFSSGLLSEDCLVFKAGVILFSIKIEETKKNAIKKPARAIVFIKFNVLYLNK
jgi:hypothetical protein